MNVMRKEPRPLATACIDIVEWIYIVPLQLKASILNTSYLDSCCQISWKSSRQDTESKRVHHSPEIRAPLPRASRCIKPDQPTSQTHCCFSTDVRLPNSLLPLLRLKSPINSDIYSRPHTPSSPAHLPVTSERTRRPRQWLPPLRRKSRSRIAC